MRQDNFKTRYVVKLASSVTIALLNIVIQVILPRALSVEDYGYYSYNLNVFTSVVVFADLSAANALVSKFSKRNEEIGLVRFYIKFWIFVNILLSGGIVLLYRTAFIQSTFAGQTIFIVVLGLETATTTKFLTNIIGMYDAMAISRFPAMMQIVLKVLISLFVIGAFILGKLNLYVFYGVQLAITISIFLVSLIFLLKEQKRQYPQEIDKGTFAYLKEYFEFCKPLIISGIVNQLVIILSNWALMHWAGAVEQAMFGAAWQMNTLVTYVFSPYAELSKREFAVVYRNNSELKRRYEQALRIVMWLTTYFAVFIGIESKWVLRVFFGDKYKGASFTTFIIMLYTIYQSWGQISGSFLLALEKTKISAGLGILSQFLMLGGVFLFQIPNAIWPNTLGAYGIAYNYLFVNIISVTVSMIIISNILKSNFIKHFSIQCLPISIALIAACFLRWILNLLFDDTFGLSFLKVMIAGAVYTLIFFVVIWNKPMLLGISKEGLLKALRIKKRS